MYLLPSASADGIETTPEAALAENETADRISDKRFETDIWNGYARCVGAEAPDLACSITVDWSQR